MFGQLDGRGGGDQVRLRMSQRTVPAMIMQPMFPLGDLNVARLTVAVAAEVVEVVTPELVLLVGGCVTVSEVAGLAVGLLAAPEVLVTVTVFDPPDPHPVRASAATAATPTSRFTPRSLPVRPPGRRRWLLAVCHRGR